MIAVEDLTAVDDRTTAMRCTAQGHAWWLTSDGRWHRKASCRNMYATVQPVVVVTDVVTAGGDTGWP
jgi:hypothetical protein